MSKYIRSTQNTPNEEESFIFSSSCYLEAVNLLFATGFHQLVKKSVLIREIRDRGIETVRNHHGKVATYALILSLVPFGLQKRRRTEFRIP